MTLGNLSLQDKNVVYSFHNVTVSMKLLLSMTPWNFSHYSCPLNDEFSKMVSVRQVPNECSWLLPCISWQVVRKLPLFTPRGYASKEMGCLYFTCNYNIIFCTVVVLIHTKLINTPSTTSDNCIRRIWHTIKCRCSSAISSMPPLHRLSGYILWLSTYTPVSSTWANLTLYRHLIESTLISNIMPLVILWYCLREQSLDNFPSA